MPPRLRGPAVARYGATELATASPTEAEGVATSDGEIGHFRVVRPFEVAPNACSNEIHTSKYKWYTFVPLNLYEQFHNLANVYFLLIAMLQTIPSISITSGRPLLLAPLAFVLAVAAVRDLVEDEQRKAADRAENERSTFRVVDAAGCKEPAQWRDVRPGHVLRLSGGDMVPADALLLNSSEPSKSCAVETSNLDGETNHKRKAPVLPEGFDWVEASRYRIEYEPPSADLYQFRGVLHWVGSDVPIGLSANNLLLRGSSLQEVEWADCLVCYAGHDTRIMRNSQGARFKASQLDVEMNVVIRIIFIVQLVLCCVGGLLFAAWEAWYYPDAWYLLPDSASSHHERALNFGVSFQLKAATWLLQLNNMVPISLIVMMTTVKFLQGKLVELDKDCFDSRLGKHAEVHTSQVLESLGMITHVFSDKTGTLTCNDMVYKACSVAGDVYGMEDQEDKPELVPSAKGSHVDFGLGGRALLQAMGTGSTSRRADMANFLLCHALCHTVNVQGREYVGPSPDELALVSAARELGLAFAGRPRQQLMELLVSADERLEGPLAAALGGSLPTAGDRQPRSLRLEILDLCEFDNDRKRMSVVVRYPDGRAVLLLKGADSSVLQCVAPGSERDRAQQHLQEFAIRGLRTLCLAARDLSEDSYAEWAARYRAALASISDDRAERVQKLSEELETGRGLRLVGVTAIEDKLQDGVPETLERLRCAGIVVWVLTGDKMETAISIGRSCKLLPDSIENVELRGDGPEVVEHLRALSRRAPSAGGRAVTIAGDTLARVLAYEDLRELFHQVANLCQTVICCRVSPKQKADVVQLVQHSGQSNSFKPVTLAIGDGANDVSMITAANVGVGLSGNEGAQAARAADFAIGQFRFLQRLLLVHGRESYRRNAVVVSYNFYKNSVLVLPAFLYGFAMSFSGQPFYEQILYQLYNVIFTFWPVVLYAILDRPVNDLSTLQEDPRSYVKGRSQCYFNSRVFILWIAAALLQGCLLVAVAFFGFADGDKAMGEVPTRDYLWMTGTAIFFWVVLGVNLTLLMRMQLVIPLTLAVTAACVLSFPICVLVLEMAGSVYLHGAFSMLFGSQSSRFLLVSVPLMLTFLMVGEPLIMASGNLSPKESKLEVNNQISVQPLLSFEGRRAGMSSADNGSPA